MQKICNTFKLLNKNIKNDFYFIYFQNNEIIKINNNNKKFIITFAEVY